MKKPKTDSICNPELYGIQENEENEIQEQSVDDDNICQSTYQSSCQSSCQNIVEFTKETEQEFIELAQKDKVNYNLWIGTQQFRKHGYIVCQYCGHIAKQKECDCGTNEKQLMDQVQKYCNKNSEINIDKARFVSILIDTLAESLRKSNLDEIQEYLEIIGMQPNKYKGFTIAIKIFTDIRPKKTYIKKYWGGFAFANDKRQIFIMIGKDKSKYKEKIDAWLSRPENIARLRDEHKRILGVVVK